MIAVCRAVNGCNYGCATHAGMVAVIAVRILAITITSLTVFERDVFNDGDLHSSHLRSQYVKEYGSAQDYERPYYLSNLTFVEVHEVAKFI